jgi:hypothetical protein
MLPMSRDATFGPLNHLAELPVRCLGIGLSGQHGGGSFDEHSGLDRQANTALCDLRRHVVESGSNPGQETEAGSAPMRQLLRGQCSINEQFPLWSM